MNRVLGAVVAVAVAAGCSSSHSSPADAKRNIDAPAIDAAADAPPDAAGSTTPHLWVLGYYVGYDIDAYPIADIDWAGLSHIAFAPMVVKADLTLDETFDDSHDAGVADAIALATAAHAHGVKALLMLGGAGAGGNILTAANATHRAGFVTALLAELDKLGYDGIDLDWEDSVDLDELVALAQALRAARPAILLTYPAGSINSNYQTVDPRMATLAAALDQFNVQTYYPSTAFAGQGWSSWFLSPLSGITAATPIAIDDTLARYAAIGIPKAKLGLGMGFYAICYTGGISAPRQPTNGTTQTIVGGDNDHPLTKFFAPNGTFATASAAEIKRDPTARAPYLALATAKNDPGCGALTRYISYEDEQSIADKADFARANGYGGTIVWTINEGVLPANAVGNRAPNALMEALHTAFLP